jgi:DNA-binding SARP family transcriptional activator
MDRVPVARVALLDGFSIELGDRRNGASDPAPRGVQRLVARLGLSQRPARTAVAGQLWPDVPEAHAHGSLRSALWRVQRLAPGLVQVSGDSLSLAEAVRVDVRELIVWARHVFDPAIRVEDLSTTDLPVRCELLPGWYDDWVLLERERLRQLHMHALEALADRLAAAGRYGEAIQAAHAAVAAEPLRESAHRSVIRIHLAEGNVVEAVRTFETFQAMLSDELGVVPTRRMRELVLRLPRQRPQPIPPAPMSAGRSANEVSSPSDRTRSR